MKPLSLGVSLLSTLILGSFAIPALAQISDLELTPELISAEQAELNATLAIQAAAANQSDSAEQLFARSLEITQNLPADEFGQEPVAQKVRLMSTIAMHMASVGQTNQAEQVFAQAEQLGREELDTWKQDTELSQVAVRLAEAGFLDRALQLTNTLYGENEYERDYGRATALNNIVSALIATGQLEAAQQVLPEVLTLAQTIAEDAGYISNGSCSVFRYEVLTAIAKNLTQLEQLQQALDVVQSVSSCSAAGSEGGTDYQQIGMEGIISVLTTPQALMQVEAVVPTLEGEYAKNRSRFEIAVKLSEAGESASARQVAQQINDAAIRDFAQLSVTAFSLSQGSETEAQQLITQAQALAQTYPNYWDGGRAWGDIGVNLVDARHIDLALQVAANQQYVVNRIAAQLAEVGQPQQALTLIEPIQDERTWQSVIPHIEDVETLNRAFEVVQEMPLDENWGAARIRSEMLLAIAQQMAKVGQVETAQQVTEVIPGQEQKVQALSSIATQVTNMASQ